MIPDPLADKYYSTSPYALCNNNPVNFVDPDGEAVETLWDIASIGMGVRNFVKNIKYGNVKNKFKYIFITSIQNPEELYSNSQPKEPKEQWLRRITEIIYLYPQSDEY